MIIPVHIIYNLLGIASFFSVCAFIFSWGAAKGIKIQSCKGDSGMCGCDRQEHKHNTTAEKILALIKE